MPAQDPLSYKRKRGGGPQSWPEDKPGRNHLAQGNRRVGNNLGGRIARGQVLKRKRTSTPNMGKVVRTLWGPNGPIERTYQRPFGSRRTFSTRSKRR